MAEQMRIEVTRGHCRGGEGNDVVPGTILQTPRDISIEDAMKTVRMGYARIVPIPPDPTPEVADPAIEERDPVIHPMGPVATPSHADEERVNVRERRGRAPRGAGGND